MTINIRDAAGTSSYLKSSGAGSSGDPYIPEHLESNSAAIAASLSVLDDWDDTDRAKVNLIVGQAGIAAGAGAVGVTVPRVTHASDDPAVTSLQLIDDPVIADDSAFTPATSKVMMAGFEADETATDSVDEGDAGAARMTLNRRIITAGQLLDDSAFGVATDYVSAAGCLADETATDSVDEGDVGVPRMTLDRKQIVTDLPHSKGGLSMSQTVSAGSTNATNVKNAAGHVYGLQVNNVNAAVRYLKLYDKASAPSVGSDTPVKTIAIPAGTVVSLSFPKGLAFTLGISFALTVEATVAGSTGVSANEHVVNIDYF